MDLSKTFSEWHANIWFDEMLPVHIVINIWYGDSLRRGDL